MYTMYMAEVGKCKCGAAKERNRQLCDSCRDRNRAKSNREYQRRLREKTRRETDLLHQILDGLNDRSLLIKHEKPAKRTRAEKKAARRA